MSLCIQFFIDKNCRQSSQGAYIHEAQQELIHEAHKSYSRSTDYFDACQQNKALVCRLTSIFWTIGFIYVDANKNDG